MKNQSRDSAVAALLSPPAPSGIAVIALRGVGAEGIVSRLFEPARASRNPLPKKSRASYGFLRFEDRIIDEVLLIRKAAPDHAFEVCCHGGTAAATAVLDALAASGASIRPWSSLLREGTLDHDLLTALLESGGTGQAALLAHLFSGCLREAFAKVEQAMRFFENDGIRSTTDDGREASSKAGGLDEAGRLAGDLIARYARGRFLHRPPRVFLTGPPNAGKSTLFNAIVGEQRVLTSRIPGTTRDTVEAVYQHRGFPVRLFDTPGFATPAHEDLAQEAQDVARQMMRRADLCLHLIEPGRNEGKDLDSARTLIESLPGSLHMLVLNKADLPTPPQAQRLEEGAAHRISALRSEGIEALLTHVDRCLGLDQLGSCFEAWIFHPRQQALLKKALKSLASGKPDEESRKKISAYLASPSLL